MIVSLSNLVFTAILCYSVLLYVASGQLLQNQKSTWTDYVGCLLNAKSLVPEGVCDCATNKQLAVNGYANCLQDAGVGPTEYIDSQRICFNTAVPQCFKYWFQCTSVHAKVEATQADLAIYSEKRDLCKGMKLKWKVSKTGNGRRKAVF